MLELTVKLVAGMLCIALVLNLWRLIIGPHVVDRILALDTMYINSIAFIDCHARVCKQRCIWKIFITRRYH
jgi:multisubunit Na+/H+ antiporter MnhF subunit